jgi:hypothetical protein
MLQLITILNRCHRFPGFVYEQAHFSSDHKSIEIAVRPRKGAKAVCSRCHQPAPGYDQLPERSFEFIPFWGFLVFLLYSMRRVDCRRCNAVVVEEVPWADGKRTLTRAYMLFLARWARKLSWKETAESFRTSWEKVFDAVEHVVTFGLEHRVLGQIDAIGVDEIQYAKGHKYLTLVYQIDLDVTRLLWVGKERTIESFQGFFTVIGDEIASKIAFVCSDMWEPYLKVIREKCSEALHILDRFHIVAKMNKALDEVRAGESRRMAREGFEPVLKPAHLISLGAGLLVLATLPPRLFAQPEVHEPFAATIARKHAFAQGPSQLSNRPAVRRLQALYQALENPPLGRLRRREHTRTPQSDRVYGRADQPQRDQAPQRRAGAHDLSVHSR